MTLQDSSSFGSPLIVDSLFSRGISSDPNSDDDGAPRALPRSTRESQARTLPEIDDAEGEARSARARSTRGWRKQRERRDILRDARHERDN